MSFAKSGRSQHSQGKRSGRPKKAGAPKREWVGTVNDLAVLKATPEELSHRHEIHKSHNRAAAQWELKEKALKQRLRHHGSPAHLDATSLSVMREVFSDKLLLQDVLARSDRAMAVVKDLFGDVPRRQTGHPSVTKAPDCHADLLLPVAHRTDRPTQLSRLSQSLMDQQALNELEGSEGDYNEEDASPMVAADANRVHRSSLKKANAKMKGRGAPQPEPRYKGAAASVHMTPCTSRSALDPAALNATLAVERVRSRQSQTEGHKEEPKLMVTQVMNPDSTLTHSDAGCVSVCTPARTSGHSCSVSRVHAQGVSENSGLSGNQSSLGLLQAMLGQVEAELDSFEALEPDTAQSSTRAEQLHITQTQSLTGFSVALVSALGRLVRLLRKGEEEAQKEAQMRMQLEQEVKEQRGLIDALTAETLTLREESTTMQAGLQQRAAELEQRLDTVVLALGGLELLTDPSEYTHEEANIPVTVSQNGPPVPGHHPKATQTPVAPAFLPPPPRQRDNMQPSPVLRSGPPPQDYPSLHSVCSNWGVQGHSESPTLASLPPASTSALTSDPVGSQLSQEAMLLEIAQLTQQNNLMKAQLHQARSQGPGVSGPGVSGPGLSGPGVSGAGVSCSGVSGSGVSGSGVSGSGVSGSGVSGSGVSGSGVSGSGVSGSGVSGSGVSGSGVSSPDGSTRSRGSLSSSVRWTTPQGSGGMSASGHGRKEAKQVHAADVVQHTPEAEATSVEQRLLELNRQSAAARIRLLELIDQQQQSALLRVSPSASPISSSAFSPDMAARQDQPGRTPEASSSLPEQDSLLLSSGRRSAGEKSLISAGGESRDSKAKGDKREGWFSLSAHVR